MSVSAPARFGLRIPEGWVELDPWRATRTGDVARLVDERIADMPQLRPHRATMIKGLRTLAEEAERAGAVYCAAAAEPAGSGDDHGQLLASLTVVSTTGMPEPALNTVEAIAAQIPATARTDTSPDWREVRIVTLAAGQAVRVRGVRTITAGRRGTATTGTPGDPTADGLPPAGAAGEMSSLSVVSMQTLIPVPDGENILDIVLTSPRVDLTEGLLDLFDAISATLSWEEGPPPR